MAELKNTIVNGILNVNGDLIASKIIKRGDAGGILRGNGNVIAIGTGTSKFLREDGTWATVSTTDTGATSIEVTGSGNAVTAASYDTSTRKITLTKGETFLKSHQSLANYVTLDGAQTITGKKTFTTGGIEISSGHLCINNTYNWANTLKLRRDTSDTESLQFQIDDSNCIMKYTNDEKSSAFKINIVNTDTEASDGSGATDKTFTFDSTGKFTAPSTINATGYVHTSLASDVRGNYVLLANGSYKPLSDFQGAGNFVTISGNQTITGIKTFSHSTFGAILLKRNGSTNASSVIFQNNNGTLGSIGMTGTANGGLQRWTADTNSVYTIWDSGNDGSGSGLDADKLDGQEGSYYYPANYYWADVKVSSSSSTATAPSVQKIGITGSTTATAAAAVTMEYDSSYKALKFVFA